MILAIVQARMGSTRLPGKVLKIVNGHSLLEIQLNRIKQSKKIQRIIVATSVLEKDQLIVDLCERLGVDCFRGSEDDVLDRFYQVARRFEGDIIVRLTADCPLIDPVIIDRVVQLFQDEKADYAANTVPPETSTFPDGSDVEVFSFAALARAHRHATDRSQREHVTFYFWKDSHDFRTVQLAQSENWSSYRLTVDYPEDLAVVEWLLQQLERKGRFGCLADIIQELREHPEIRSANSMHSFGEGWSKPRAEIKALHESDQNRNL